MKSIIIASAIAIAALSANTASFAQQRDRQGSGRAAPRVEQQTRQIDSRPGRQADHRVDDGRRYKQGNSRKHAGRSDRYDRHDRHDRRNRYGRAGNKRFYGPPSRKYYGARGSGYYRGARISREYRSPVYVVEDWRAHRLSAPRRDQRWVQVGSDYVLVAIATGVIVQLLLNH